MRIYRKIKNYKYINNSKPMRDPGTDVLKTNAIGNDEFWLEINASDTNYVGLNDYIVKIYENGNYLSSYKNIRLNSNNFYVISVTKDGYSMEKYFINNDNKYDIQIRFYLKPLLK